MTKKQFEWAISEAIARVEDAKCVHPEVVAFLLQKLGYNVECGPSN